jgi:heat shock protein HslJ
MMIYARSWLRTGLLALLLGLAGCQRQEPATPRPQPSPTIAPPATPLDNSTWELVQYGTVLSPSLPLAAEHPFLSFGPGGQLGGSTGCNGMFGSYVVTGTLLTLDQLGRSDMGCELALRDQEDQFLATLPRVSTWTVVTDTLTLSDGASALRFIRSY